MSGLSFIDANLDRRMSRFWDVEFKDAVARRGIQNTASAIKYLQLDGAIVAIDGCERVEIGNLFYMVASVCDVGDTEAMERAAFVMSPHVLNC